MAEDFERTVGNSEDAVKQASAVADRRRHALNRVSPTQALLAVPFIAAMGPGNRATLMQAAKHITIPMGEYVCKRRQHGDRMWVLIDGKVDVMVTADWDGTGPSEKTVLTIKVPSSLLLRFAVV